MASPGARGCFAAFATNQIAAEPSQTGYTVSRPRDACLQIRMADRDKDQQCEAEAADADKYTVHRAAQDKSAGRKNSEMNAGRPVKTMTPKRILGRGSRNQEFVRSLTDRLCGPHMAFCRNELRLTLP